MYSLARITDFLATSPPWRRGPPVERGGLPGGKVSAARSRAMSATHFLDWGMPEKVGWLGRVVRFGEKRDGTPTLEEHKRMDRRRLRKVWGPLACCTLLTVPLFASIGCKSMQDGARQVSLGAQDLGRRMSEPFRKGSGSSDYSNREGRSESDPFLPPPRRPDDETSSLIPRPLSVATLGEPILDNRVARVSKPLTPE
jgi:hypothetical protein